MSCAMRQQILASPFVRAAALSRNRAAPRAGRPPSRGWCLALGRPRASPGFFPICDGCLRSYRARRSLASSSVRVNARRRPTVLCVPRRGRLVVFRTRRGTLREGPAVRGAGHWHGFVWIRVGFNEGSSSSPASPALTRAHDDHSPAHRCTCPRLWNERLPGHHEQSIPSSL